MRRGANRFFFSSRRRHTRCLSDWSSDVCYSDLILHGMIFIFLAFVGFESSAPLAEEALHPRRTVPRAILLAAVSIGIFYVFCSYAGVVGWEIGRASV